MKDGEKEDRERESQGETDNVVERICPRSDGRYYLFLFCYHKIVK